MTKQYVNESGEVAMLMVGIFTAVFSVLVVGLSYIVMNTVRNSNNDNASHNARVVAESGIEDAKRLLKYCYIHDFGHTDRDSDAYKLCDILYKAGRQGCNDILGSDAWKKIVGLATDEKDGSLRVKVSNKDANDKEAQQYYQCLRVNMMTRSYDNKITDLAAGGRSIVLPLRVINSRRQRNVKVKRLVVSWHSTKQTPEGDGDMITPPQGTTLLPKGEWNAKNYPAVVRAQFVPVPRNGNVTLWGLTKVNRVVTLRPTSDNRKLLPSSRIAGGHTYKVFSSDKIAIVNSTIEDENLTNPRGDIVNLDEYEMSDQPNNVAGHIPLVGVVCNDKKAAYACSVSFTVGGGMDTDKQDWFLRLNSVYGNTHFRITAYDENDQPLWFDGVQTEIDVTGKSADSYVRLATRVKPINPDNQGTRNWWPEYALEIGGGGKKAGLCKDIVSKFAVGNIYCDPNGHHSHSDYFKY